MGPSPGHEYLLFRYAEEYFSFRKNDKVHTVFSSEISMGPSHCHEY